ncbi:hypothetical protein NB636_05565 [Oxalobacter aliiformigenes]|uniref:hypothetical protein n=1 Tax=Oxalobacter aliiformigenes TaxID=2946593 RepID=UPI0022AFBE91|nr:hypothetical protein [Oxalobacter aliiformigenes]MCZ4065821.1 hypothetical protein [Oxalobacter aliiformigenes]WAW00314.1 hypothetical protein NB636_05565 [Oxalobacter aliiformigenes]
MEKKLTVLAATLLAKGIWNFGKITSEPLLRMTVFCGAQATVTTPIPVICKRFGKKRPAKVT